MTKEELQEIIAIDEGFRIELTTSKVDMDKFQETICAFANDMPGSGKKGYLLIGVYVGKRPLWTGSSRELPSCERLSQ